MYSDTWCEFFNQKFLSVRDKVVDLLVEMEENRMRRLKRVYQHEKDERDERRVSHEVAGTEGPLNTRESERERVNTSEKKDKVKEHVRQVQRNVQETIRKEEIALWKQQGEELSSIKIE